MGATTFQNTVKATSAGEAFDKAQAEAFWESGHGGYTGTIAEKPGYIEFPLPEGVTSAEFLTALENSYSYWQGGRLTTPEDPEWASRYPRWDEAKAAYDSKWGPAVAFPGNQPGWWVLCGWASC